jgi:hypothetical protein
VLVKDGRVIGASITLDYVDYIAMPKIRHSNPLMTLLGKYADMLDAQIPAREGPIVRGQIAYGLYGVIDPEFANNGYSLKFWTSQFEMGKLFGWKAYYSRLASERSYSMLRSIGAEKVAQVSVAESPGSNIYLGRLNLPELNVTYDRISEMLSMLKQAAKDKARAQAQAKAETGPGKASVPMNRAKL